MTDRHSLKTTVLSIGTGIVFSLSMLIFFAPSPKNAALDFITGTFSTSFYLGTFLNSAVLLIIAGLGNSVSLKSGNLNLGGEGQIYAGGFVSALIFSSKLPPFVAVTAALLAAAAAGALQTTVCAFLRQIKKANVLLTSFLISAALIPLIDSLIAGKYRTQTGNLLATEFVPENLRLLQILKPSPLNISLFTAPLLCLAFHLFLHSTRAGRKLDIWGKAPEFARYCGYSENKALYMSLAISGAMHGLTGALAVWGTYHTCHSGFYAGMGWNALSCTLIAQSEPLLLIPAGLILSGLYTSADRIALMQGIQFDISSLIQGIILLCISVNYIARKRRT